MKSDFNERREARLERAKRLAKKNEALANSAYKNSNKILEHIPLGQPILVGHHSERRHRNDLKKVDILMRKSIEAENKAEYYSNMVENIEKNKSIDSDDPEAVLKLTSKLEHLQRLQELMKKANKIIRKPITEAEKVMQLETLGMKQEQALKLIEPGRFGGMGFAHFELSNNNAQINRIKARISQLKKIENLVETDEIINGARLMICPDDNRVKLFFEGKPSHEIIKSLKQNGFHWSPLNSCWMRKISDWAIFTARNILNNL